MKEILLQYVPNWNGRTTKVQGYKAYIDADTIYFIIPEHITEELCYQQKVIGDYLIQHGCSSVATPIPNFRGQFVTEFNDKTYVAYQVNYQQIRKKTGSHGQSLAEFHRIGSTYPYEPTLISSYGRWKQLWIDKITYFEQLYTQQLEERPVTRFQRLFIDTFPYLIGLAENAVQYLQESEKEWRFDESDRPTITFQRYKGQIQHEVLWTSELAHDHHSRDIAEQLRTMLLRENNMSFQNINTFISDYQRKMNVSIFGWRLVYARLLFPIHLFDFVVSSIEEPSSDSSFHKYRKLLARQSAYEEKLKSFYKGINVDSSSLNIPVIDW